MTPIGDYLRELERVLQERHCHDPRIVDEAREHLADAAEDGVRRGLAREDAERDAIERFGPAALIAAQALPGRSRMMARLTAAVHTVVGHWRWIAAATAAAALLTSVASYYWLPTRYRSEVVVSVSRLPTPGGTEPSGRRSVERLQAISDTILSSPRLESVAKDLGLDKSHEARTPIADTVQQMRRNIGVEVSREGEPARFTVSFQSPDPRVAMRVTERIAGMFIQENLQQADGVAELNTILLDSEIASVRFRLAALEAQLEGRRAQKIKLSRADLIPFEVLQARYRSLLVKREDVRSAAALQRGAFGEQYQIVEGARVPDHPVGPSRPGVNATGTLAGLTIAVAATLIRRRPAALP
jgi:uncharacterized protein involved in exopolysaccharide biosynthesis